MDPSERRTVLITSQIIRVTFIPVSERASASIRPHKHVSEQPDPDSVVVSMHTNLFVLCRSFHTHQVSVILSAEALTVLP